MVSVATTFEACDSGAPERAPAWLAVASLTLSSFASVSTEFMPVGLLTDIAATLHVSAGSAGLMVTMPAVAGAVTGPLVTVLSGRLDRRVVLLVLSALLVVSNVLAALAWNLPVMLVARLLLGVCVGGFWTFAPTATGHLVPQSAQARAISYVMAGVSVATVVGVPAGALIGALAGWRAAFGAIAALATAVLVLQLRVLPAMPASRAIRARDLLLPFEDRAARVVLIGSFLLVCGHFTGYTYLRPILEQVFALSPGAIAALLLVFGATGFGTTFVAGRVVTNHARATVFAAAAAIALALLFGLFAGAGVAAATAAVLLWGAAFGLVPVATATWMMRALPAATEAGQAMLVCAFQVGISTGAFVGGRVVDARGVVGVLVVGAILAGLAAAVIALARRGRAA